MDFSNLRRSILDISDELKMQGSIRIKVTSHLTHHDLQEKKMKKGDNLCISVLFGFDTGSYVYRSVSLVFFLFLVTFDTMSDSLQLK